MAKQQGVGELPNYINDLGHGQQCYPAPLSIDEVVGYGFPCRVNRKKLQAFINSQLNAVTKEVHFEALPFIIHVWTSVGRATTDAEVVGWMSDQESMFFVPLVQWQLHPNGKKKAKIGLTFWVPYLFIDVMAGMVTAREIYGYRKMPAAIKVPRKTMFAADFWADTVVFTTFSEQTEGEHMRLLQTKGPSNAQQLISEWKNEKAALKSILELLGGHLVAELLIEFEEFMQQKVGKFKFPMVCLKQFRDCADSSKACYQALVNSPGVLDQWTGGGILIGDFRTRILKNASYKIVEDLGLKASNQTESEYIVKPLFGFWITMNFTLANGELIWQASTT